MSQPPNYRPPAAAAQSAAGSSTAGAAPAAANPTATPAARPANSELSTILMNIPNLVKMANSGGLTEIQIRQLRQLIRQHTPTILANAQNRGLPNPLLNLPPILDPHQPWEGAIATAVIKKPNPPAATPAAAGTTAAPQTLAQRQAAAAAAAAASGSTSSATTGNATQTPVQRPSAPITLSEQQVRAMINLTPQQREAYFANNPNAKTAFQTYITRLRAHSNQTQRAATAANSAAAPGTASSTTGVLPNLSIPANARRDGNGPNQTLGQGQRAPINNQSGNTMQRPEEQQRLLQMQDEVLIRKRRLREILAEREPQVELEVGVAEVLKDAADEFMADILREACRLARHRKAQTVEVKDIALATDMHHSIVIPGFQGVNDQSRPNTTTIDDTQRRRARGVFPRRRAALEAVTKAKEES